MNTPCSAFLTKILIILLIALNAGNTLALSDQLIVDQYWSPYAGSALNTSLFHTYTFLDDKYLPNSDGKESFWWGMGRFGKILLEDLYCQFLMVMQHEVFGHGYRLREFGFKDIGYVIGIGFGSTGFSSEEYDNLSLTKQAAVSAAGMEANAVFSGQIRRNWILQQHIDRRDALLYFITSLDQADYIWVTTDESSSPSNDVNSYVYEVNAWYDNEHLTKSKLRHYAYWDLLDPCLFMGLYSIGEYIFNGSPNQPTPMIDIRNYKYIFAGRLLLAPYGSEFQMQNYVLTPQQQLAQVNVRYGNNSHLQSYGVDIFWQPIWRYKDLTVGNKLFLWRQPKFLKQNTAAGVGNMYGVAELINAEYKLYKCFSALGEFGYKTAGYIQGIPLGNSWVWRLGVKLSYNVVPRPPST